MIETKDINNDVVRLEMPATEKRVGAIKRLKGPFVFDRIICDNCLTVVNPLSPEVWVNKRNISFGLTINIVYEPQCPVCGNFIVAEHFFHIEN